MLAPQMIALIASGLFIGGFAGNEFSHGGLAESMGLGHHHMADYGGYHCSGPSDHQHWADHVDHMHGGAVQFGDHCGAGHMRADHDHIGDGSHGPMGPGHDGMGGMQ